MTILHCNNYYKGLLSKWEKNETYCYDRVGYLHNRLGWLNWLLATGFGGCYNRLCLQDGRSCQGICEIDGCLRQLVL